ncbi:forkhead box protein H1 isoform X2 [Polypterus senegalus]
MTKHWGSTIFLGQPVFAYLPSASPCFSPIPADLHRDCTEPLQSETPKSTQDYPRASSVTNSALRNSFASNPSLPWSTISSPWPMDLRTEKKAVTAGSPIERLKLELEQKSMEEKLNEFESDSLNLGPQGQLADQDGEKNSDLKKGKKNYKRYPKPPYSYLAMIAMVIQNSPEKKLTLSQIFKEISTLFPFFKGKYKGWRDSVRHNLSCYDCFVKVLKDPNRPQGKGNFWAVDVTRVPPDLLKRQNTAISRQEEAIFVEDLSPYILHEQSCQEEQQQQQRELPVVPVANNRIDANEMYRPKLDSSFAIDSLLHTFKPATNSLDQPSKAYGSKLEARPFVNELPLPDPYMRQPSALSCSTESRSTSGSTVSPASSSSSENDSSWQSGRLASKRSREMMGGDDGSDSDAYDDCATPMKSSRRCSAPWELPTSYAKYAPPNAVAPPSMRFSNNPLLQLGGLPFYNIRPPQTAYMGPGYWSLLPPSTGPLQAYRHRPPHLFMDLDNLLQSVPPNKSVFDVLVPEPPVSQVGQYNAPAAQHAGTLSRYTPF